MGYQKPLLLSDLVDYLGECPSHTLGDLLPFVLEGFGDLSLKILFIDRGFMLLDISQDSQGILCDPSTFPDQRLDRFHIVVFVLSEQSAVRADLNGMIDTHQIQLFIVQQTLITLIKFQDLGLHLLLSALLPHHLRLRWGKLFLRTFFVV